MWESIAGFFGSLFSPGGEYTGFFGIDFWQLLFTWGIYLVIILMLALPQLFNWTFSQASGSGFTTSHFNWSNQGDPYLWFYIKNF